MLAQSLSVLALSTSQLVMMILSFAAMLGFGGLAVWLWLKQRRADAAPPTRSTPPAKPAPVQREPARDEPTEFVALPGQREEDSPQVQGHVEERTEFVAPPGELTSHIEAEDEPVERTEFIANPIAAAAPAVEERTSFLAPPPAVEERTSFIAPPPAVEERTSFIAPPPAVEERTSFVAPPPTLAPPPPTPTLASPPIEEPKHVELPSPPAPRIDPPATADRTPELREHFDLAVGALTKLELHDDSDEATRLHGHLEVLASAPVDPLLELVRPLLADPSHPSAPTAWLALLQHKTWPAKRSLPQLLEGLDEPARKEGMRALASWEDPRAASLASAALEHGANKPEWLELFADRGWDPGDAAIDEALSSTNPRLLIAGLRLAGTRPPEQVRAKVSAQLFAADPAVRIEAIETALVFREQSAWLVCRQLARNPAFPRAAELVGLLGSETEVAQLCQAASIAGSAPILWGLGLSGRPIALETCAAALNDSELREAAQAALAIALGHQPDSPEAARELIATQSAARRIGGAPRTLDALANTLTSTDSLPLRRAIARELRVRARGRVLATPELRPRAWRRQLDELRRLDLDLQLDFPWTAESR